MMPTLYLLHFTKPLAQAQHRRGIHAGHYLGISDDLERRLHEHATGNGSRLCAAAKARGSEFILVKVWHNVTRAHELEMKRQRNNPRHCYLCNPKYAATSKARLSGDNKKFAGWKNRQVFASAHPAKVKFRPTATQPDDEYAGIF